jgi:hypothetical protein
MSGVSGHVAEVSRRNRLRCHGTRAVAHERSKFFYDCDIWCRLLVCNYNENSRRPAHAHPCGACRQSSCIAGCHVRDGGHTSENVPLPRSAGRSKYSCARPFAVTSGLCRRPRCCRVRAVKGNVGAHGDGGKGPQRHHLAGICCERFAPLYFCMALAHWQYRVHKGKLPLWRR